MQDNIEAPLAVSHTLALPGEATPFGLIKKLLFVSLAAAIILASTILVFSASVETPGNVGYQKAMLALINRQFPEAISSFAKLQTSYPAMSDKITLPYAEALLGHADNLRKNDPKQAIVLLRKALQLDPRSVRAHFQLGLVLTSQKDYVAAIESYQKAIALNPKFPDTFFNLGFVYAVSKNYAKAEEMYDQAIALKPDYLDEALFNLAIIQDKQNKKEQSLANLKKALTVNPKNQSVQNYLKKTQGVSAE